MARIVKTSSADAESVGGSFTPLPEGNYIAQIIDVKDGEFKSQANAGKPKLELEFKIVEGPDGEGEGRKLREFNLPLFPKWGSGSVAFTFYQFFKAIGIEFPEGEGEVELPENEDLWELEVGIRVIQEPDYKDKTITRNKVNGYFPATDGVSAAKPRKAQAAASDDMDLDL